MALKAKNHSMFDYVSDARTKTKSTHHYKPKEILEFSDAAQEALNLRGFDFGSIIRLVGKSDTGKSTEALMICKKVLEQEKAIPVYIDLENKFNFERAKFIGLPIHQIKINTIDGETMTEGDEGYEDFGGDDVSIAYEGDIIHIDKNGLSEKYHTDPAELVTAEDVMNYMTELFKYQTKMSEKGVTINFLFIIDSYDRMHSKRWLDQIGGLKSDLAAASDKSKAQNQADVQYKNNILEIINDALIKKTKSKSVPFSNALILINNGYDFTVGTQSTLKATGGHKAKHLMDLDIFFGGKLGEGISVVKKMYKGIDYEIGKQVKIEAVKTHSGVEKAISKGTIINTAFGSIPHSELNGFFDKNKEFFTGIEVKENE